MLSHGIVVSTDVFLMPVPSLQLVLDYTGFTEDKGYIIHSFSIKISFERVPKLRQHVKARVGLQKLLTNAEKYIQFGYGPQACFSISHKTLWLCQLESAMAFWTAIWSRLCSWHSITIKRSSAVEKNDLEEKQQMECYHLFNTETAKEDKSESYRLS